MWRSRCIAAAAKRPRAPTSTRTIARTSRGVPSSPLSLTRSYASTASSSTSSTPVFKYTLAILLLTGATYTGAAYYALHDPSFRKTWIENVPGGQEALDKVAAAADALKQTRVDDVKGKAEQTVMTVGKTVHDIRETATEKYEKTVETLSDIKEGAAKTYGTAVQKIQETQGKAQEKIDNISAFIGTVKEEAVATYEVAHSKVKQAEASVRDFAHSVEETYENTRETVEDAYEHVRSLVTGEPPRAKAPKPVKELPKPVAEKAPEPIAVIENKPPQDQIALRPAASAEKPTSTAKPVKAEAKPASKVQEKPKAEPKKVPVKPAVDAAVVVIDDAEKAEAGVVVVSGEGPAVVPAADRPTAENTLEQSFKSIESAFENIPERPIAQSLAHSITTLAVTLGNLIGSTDEAGRDKLEKARKQLVALTDYLNALETEEAALIKNALQNQAAKFSKTLQAHQEASTKALRDQASDFENKFGRILEDERERLISKHNTELAEKLSEQAREFQSSLDAELRRQADELEKYWTKEIKTRVDEERGGRLARLDHLALKLKYLERISLEAGESLGKSHKIHLLWSALKAVTDVLDQPYQTPLTKELSLLQKLSTDFDHINTILSTIPGDVLSSGVPTPHDLTHRFSKVSTSIRKAQYMPSHGGPLSYVFSNLLNAVTFKKSGLVPGDDVESVLARGEFYLDQGDVESAVREVNQLRGWSRVLVREWVEGARRYLEVKQALEVVETELSLMSLGAV